MTAVGRMPVAFIKDLLKLATREAITFEELLNEAGIPQDTLHSRKMLTFTECLQLLLTNIQMRDDEGHGLGAEPMKSGFFELSARLAMHEDTVGEALKTILDYYNIARSDLKCAYRESDGFAYVGVKSTINKRKSAYFSEENALIAFHIFTCWFVDADFPIERVSLRRKRYAPEDDIHGFLAAPVFFDEDACELRFSAKVMNWPRRQNYEPDILQQIVARLLRRRYEGIDGFDNKGALNIRIRRILQIRLQSANQIAARLGISETVLRRKLVDEGVSFSEIRTQVLMERAQFLLMYTALPVDEIADDLGYSEASSFARAFRRQFKIPPGEYRKINSSF
ncbi:MAG: AraC family transcriptional regulator ligand-binding domain-containing protein [Pseudomonadota bacterium]